MIRAFSDITPSDLALVGGKGLNLGALCAAGFPVPGGFCVTTAGFTAFVSSCGDLPALLDALDALDPSDVDAARALGQRVRATLLSVPLPDDLRAQVLAAWTALGPEHAYAVRSSATAEDLPGASFAGQQDTYLNVRGGDALLEAVRRCFVSLFTDRAILYRARGGFGHRAVALSVVVQRMVFPQAAGVLFTADPVSGHRGTCSIDAGFGLGEALVSGLVNADLYRVDKRSGALREVRVGDKALLIRPLPGGGTEQAALPPEQRRARVLSDEQIEALVRLGRAVESHYGGAPQDIEWAFADGALYLLQARPITSLFPLVTPSPTDGALHVYFSFSHGQNMTDPISPLGRDLLRVLLPLGKDHPTQDAQDSDTLVDAGGRLYIDVTRPLQVEPLRRLILALLGGVYPDLAQGIAALADRPQVRAAGRPSFAALHTAIRMLAAVPPRLLYRRLLAPPEEIPAWATAQLDEIVTWFRAPIDAAGPGAARLRATRAALARLFARVVRFPPPLGAGLLALRGLRQRFQGTEHAADVEALQRGLHGNITTQMDLEVGDLADLARPHPALCAALRAGVSDRAALSGLRQLPGGDTFVTAVEAFLTRYGMRGQGEIDIARPRWADQPGLILSSIAGNLASDTRGAHRAHFQRQQAEAEAAGERLVAAAGGPWARRRMRRLVGVIRYGLGMREHPKFVVIRCLGIARQVILEAAAALVQRGALSQVDDVWSLRLDELQAQIDGTGADVRALIAARRAEQERFSQLIPPLVVTSEGESPVLQRALDLPAGALAGLGASAGVVEGVARVVLDPAAEVLHAGEILVAPYTDPGWTPLFMHAAGLVCDVGGMMTHGSVVAREYGIPAVVGVGDGTRRLRTGQRLRVDGSRGVVEVLGQEARPAEARP